MRPAFPIEVRGVEWPPDMSHSSPEELGANVEHVDDYDPPYEAWDGASYRVRLIVWDLDVLVAQVVPDDFDPRHLELRVKPGPSGGHIYQEVFRGEVLRTVLVDRDGIPTSAEPIHWEIQLNDQPGAPVLDMSARDFHALWMRARVGRRWP